jgi:hypothetical protein
MQMQEHAHHKQQDVHSGHDEHAGHHTCSGHQCPVAKSEMTLLHPL